MIEIFLSGCAVGAIAYYGILMFVKKKLEKGE